MTVDPMHGLHPSREARCVFAYLRRCGGSMRLGPLLRGLGIDPRIFVEAVNELSERYWITIVWRRAAPETLAEETRPLTDIYRLCSTRFGRRKYRSRWALD